MSGPKARSLAAPLDGAVIFEQASSLAGLSLGWQRVRENAGSAGGDGISIESFASEAAARISSMRRLQKVSRQPGRSDGNVADLYSADVEVSVDAETLLHCSAVRCTSQA